MIDNHIKKVTIDQLMLMKQQSIPIAAVTAYDASFARIAIENKIDLILVGDSLGVTVAGYDTTVSVTIEHMIYHTECVKRGVDKQGALIMADMPFLTYSNASSALKNAAKLMRAGAEIIKCEGGAWLAETVSQLHQNGISFCGHLGLTPQSVFTHGYKICLDEKEKQKMISDAKELRDAGMQLLILKCVHHQIAKEITQLMDIPVIGVGAGKDCDGQILLLNDLLGFGVNQSALLSNDYNIATETCPKKHYRNFLANNQNGISGAINNYVTAVKSRTFPNKHEYY